VTGRQLKSVLHCLRGITRPPESLGLSDATVLERWVANRDEGAFELLLWRHGPTVFSVCRRVLRQPQDIEDAVQATFLVLVQKARSISKHEALGSWLYKVALRIALRVKERAAKQARRTLQDVDMPSAESPDELLWQDVRSTLDEEINRLPERYRTAFVMSYVEGKTNEETARLLGVPTGTILSRLARARGQLRTRLARRGLALSSGILTAALAGQAPAANIPSPLVGSIMKAVLHGTSNRAVAAGAVSAQAAALTQRVLCAMWVDQIKKITAVAVLATAVLGGGGMFIYRTLAVGPADTPTQTARPAVAERLQVSQTRDEAKAARAVVREKQEQSENQERNSATRSSPQCVQGPPKEVLEAAKKLERERHELEKKLDQVEAWRREAMARLEKLQSTKATSEDLAALEKSLRLLLTDLDKLRHQLLRQEDLLVQFAPEPSRAVRK
jgi:RNA polymerase sigma factor (sigma-70 family)